MPPATAGSGESPQGAQRARRPSSICSLALCSKARRRGCGQKTRLSDSMKICSYLGTLLTCAFVRRFSLARRKTPPTPRRGPQRALTTSFFVHDIFSQLLWRALGLARRGLSGQAADLERKSTAVRDQHTGRKPRRRLAAGTQAASSFAIRDRHAGPRSASFLVPPISGQTTPCRIRRNCKHPLVGNKRSAVGVLGASKHARPRPRINSTSPHVLPPRPAPARARNLDILAHPRHTPNPHALAACTLSRRRRPSWENVSI